MKLDRKLVLQILAIVIIALLVMCGFYNIVFLPGFGFS